MKPVATFAQAQEKDILLRYPRMEEQLPALLAAKSEIGWPDWCYLPMSASYAIVTQGAEKAIAQRMMQSRFDDFYAVSALIPWRVYKPVYRFDDDLADALMKTESSEETVPVEVLKTLPYPCVCIEHPQGLPDCECLYAFLEYDYRYPDTMELRLHYAYRDGMVAIYLQWTPDRPALTDAMVRSAVDSAKSVTELPPVPRYDECAAIARRHLNLILYLCSDTPDVTRTAPEPRIRGRDNRQKTAAYPDQLTVGAYIGATLRKSAAQPHTDSIPTGEGAPKRPHVRRAHFHLYWIGEKRSIPRVRWVHPIFVHGDTPDAVVHKVKP